MAERGGISFHSFASSSLHEKPDNLLVRPSRPSTVRRKLCFLRTVASSLQIPLHSPKIKNPTTSGRVYLFWRRGSFVFSTPTKLLRSLGSQVSAIAKRSSWKQYLLFQRISEWNYIFGTDSWKLIAQLFSSIFKFNSSFA